MKKKLMIISVAGVLALGGLAAIGVAGTGGSLSLATATSTHDKHTDSDGEEHAFYAPGIEDDRGVAYETGNKPYWRCNSCCSGNPESARYDINDHTKALALSDVQLPALTKVTSGDVAKGDQIANVNVNKIKYLDQGKKGVTDENKDVASDPWFVQEDGKTAIYFSASGKTGAATNPTSNAGCAEFRFTVPSGLKKVKSVTFSYKYQNWGTGTWAGGTSTSEPSAFSALCSFHDTAWVGCDVSSELVNDGNWNTLTIDYSGGTTSNFTDFSFKFADLRGYIMISGLTYVTDGVEIDGSALPASYKASATRDYMASGSHTGATSSDPYDYVLNSSVALKDSSGNATGKTIKTSKFTAANVQPTGSLSSGFYVRFKIETEGKYGIFTSSSHNPGIRQYAKVADDGTIGSFTGIYKYDNGGSSNGLLYCNTGKDAHAELDLEEGVYVLQINAYSTGDYPASDLDLGIVKLTDGGASVYEDDNGDFITAEPDASTFVSTTDTYESAYIKNSAFYSSSAGGVVTIDGTVRSFSKVDDDYIYDDTTPTLDTSTLDSVYGWSAILSDKNLAYVSSSNGIDTYTVDFTGTLADDASPICSFLSLLGIDKSLVSSFDVSADSASKTAAFSVAFKGDESPVSIAIEEVTELPITVNSYDVPNKGEAGSDSGVTQEW